MPSVLEEVIERERRKLDAGEQKARARMAYVYQRQVTALLADLTLMTQRIDDARANGEEVNPDWLRRQTRYVRLIQQADALFKQFSDDGLGLMKQNQLEAALLGSSAGLAIMRAAGIGIEFDSNINTQATERLAASFVDDSPLRDVLESYGTNGRDVITQELIDGMAAGKGPRQMIADIRRGLTEQPTWRLDALVRTEMMRSFRGSLFDQYDGHVDQWEWTASHSVRTCKACLAMSGQRFPMSRKFLAAHVCCRCIPSPVPEKLYGDPPETGSEWFARQDPATRRRMMSKEAFEAYEAGELELQDYVGVKQDRTWGPSIQEKSNRQALRDRQARKDQTRRDATRGPRGLGGGPNGLSAGPTTPGPRPRTRRGGYPQTPNVINLSGPISTDPRVSTHLNDPKVASDRAAEQLDIKGRFRDARNMSTQNAAAEVNTLRSQGGVLVGSIPKSFTKQWPDGSGEEVVIRARRRNHYRRRHRETKGADETIIETIRNPDRSFTYPDDPTVVNLTKTVSADEDMFVSVQLAYGDEQYAVVRSARQQNKSETERWIRMGREVK